MAKTTNPRKKKFFCVVRMPDVKAPRITFELFERESTAMARAKHFCEQTGGVNYGIREVRISMPDDASTDLQPNQECKVPVV